MCNIVNMLYLANIFVKIQMSTIKIKKILPLDVIMIVSYNNVTKFTIFRSSMGIDQIGQS